MDVDIEDICKVIVASAGGAATVVLTPAILATLGFTGGGIAAGSIAAKLMSWIAFFYRVPAASLFALAQSIGAGGLSWFGSGFLLFSGGGLGWILSTICNRTIIISEYNNSIIIIRI
ncbi:Interferon alpha-inducible protein 6 Interferon-induced protein 6-16 [Channa argus]|uniref:Interferon alpha-inducible protein 6 Interferon-induced protein 6-16 n=1 Tax=Channa argus TaxID=215402 RepID=A0A6G1QFP3_CHAAH|nr:Interferon alpha-inducible protein 6 Interferon-induced protein 6-16 [Channa argus]